MKNLLLALVGVMMALLLIVGCAAPKPAPVERTVKVAWLADMTGPTAASVIPMVWGTQDWFKHVNEQGGINGVKVDVIWADAAYKLDRGLEIYSKWAADEDILCIHCCSTHINDAIADKCAKDEIVLYAASPAPNAMWPIRWTYSHSAGYGDQIGSFVDWALDNWKEKRPFKLGLMYMDMSFGKTIFDGGGVNYCKARGVEMAGDEPIPPMATDITAHLARLSNAKPDYIYFQGTVDLASVICRDVKKTGFGIPIMFCANVRTEQLIYLAGKESTEGAICMGWSNPWWGLEPSEMSPGLKKTADFFAKNRPAEQPATVGVGYYHGLMGGMVTGEAIRLALEKVTAQNLTGRALKENGFDRLKNFTDTWELNPGITYTPTDHRGNGMIKIVQVKGGLGRTIKDWFKTPYLVKDECIWSKYVKPGRWEDILGK